jgi:hypothetical protein
MRVASCILQFTLGVFPSQLLSSSPLQTYPEQSTEQLELQQQQWYIDDVLALLHVRGSISAAFKEKQRSKTTMTTRMSVCGVDKQ